jgi:antibiotic biosynthesis monooxygenase (ABM) superfamily enzyme
MLDFLVTAIVWAVMIYLCIFVLRSIIAYATDKPLPKSLLVETLVNVLLIFFIANRLTTSLKA